jgi:hypothetical protein
VSVTTTKTTNCQQLGIYKSCPSRSISAKRKSISLSVTAADEMMFLKKFGLLSSGWYPTMRVPDCIILDFMMGHICKTHLMIVPFFCLCYLSEFLLSCCRVRHFAQTSGNVPETDVYHFRLHDQVELVGLVLDALHHVLRQFHQPVHVLLEAVVALNRVLVLVRYPLLTTIFIARLACLQTCSR